MTSTSLIAPLIADLGLIAAMQPAAWPAVVRLRESDPGFATRAPLVLAAAGDAKLGLYRTVALLLKLLVAEDRSSLTNGYTPSGRFSWEDVLARLREPLGAVVADLPVAEWELLVIEQHALAAGSLSVEQVAALATRHEHERSLLAAAGPGERDAFMGDKRDWLLQEINLDELLAVRDHVVKEIVSARMQYEKIVGPALIDLVEAAYRVALLRYRVALDDPSLKPEAMRLHLLRDLWADDGAGALLCFEPALRNALLDTEEGVQADYKLLYELESLQADGRLQPASSEECAEAAREFRQLARLIHTDYLKKHPQYGQIAPRNQERLEEIWNLASATHRGRVQLSRERVLDFLANLRKWKEEVQRILAHLAFPTPSLLLRGDTLQERYADLRRAMRDVQDHMHAVHEEISVRECDPLHGEHQRVIALNEEGRAAECDRMAALAEAWNAEARQLAAQLAAREGGTDAGSPRDEEVSVSRPQQGEQQP